LKHCAAVGWLALAYAGAALSADVSPTAVEAHAAGTASAAAPRATRRQLVGTWRLVRIDVSGPQGPVPDPFYQPESTGCIVYDASGWMSVQIAGPRRQAWMAPANRDAGTSEHDARLKAAAFDSYYAYYGTWSLDEATSVVVHQVQVSLIPAENGAHYAQTASIDGKGRLILASTDTIKGAPVVRTKVWQRIVDSAGDATRADRAR
jgi:hypothetical protein